MNCWINRTLSVYGKLVIIKTLALSKLSHLALVLPNLDSHKLKSLENLLFTFLWNNKPDKVSRDHTKLSEKAGGLGFVDIKSFWQALKISWFRRALSTNAFWPTILEQEVSVIMGRDVALYEILQFGPNMFTNIGKKMKNNFWKGVFCSVDSFMQGAIFCNPENIFTAPLWDNPMIKRNNKPLKGNAFPILSSKLSTISNLYKPCTSTMLTRIELENSFDIAVNEETFIEFQYIIKTAIRSIGVQENFGIATFQPFQPLLISLVNSVKKGCNLYYKYIRKKINISTSLVERETRWHNELNSTFGTDFWNATYNLASSIKNENKIKWLQYQINRNCLFTNYKVNKFKPNISPFCTFCSHVEGVLNLESISHIFYDCDFTLQLWQTLRTWLQTFNKNIPLNRTAILFGLHDQPSTSVENFLILCGKYYIWKTKFQSTEISFTSFKGFLKYKLEELRNACSFEEKDAKFEQWLLIYDCL